MAFLGDDDDDDGRWLSANVEVGGWPHPFRLQHSEGDGLTDAFRQGMSFGSAFVSQEFTLHLVLRLRGGVIEPSLAEPWWENVEKKPENRNTVHVIRLDWWEHLQEARGLTCSDPSQPFFMIHSPGFMDN